MEYRLTYIPLHSSLMMALYMVKHVGDMVACIIKCIKTNLYV